MLNSEKWTITKILRPRKILQLWSQLSTHDHSKEKLMGPYKGDLQSKSIM